jgi:hypothetical protein
MKVGGALLTILIAASLPVSAASDREGGVLAAQTVTFQSAGK